MKFTLRKLFLSILFASFMTAVGFAQAVPPGTIEVQSQQAAYPLIAISSTAAVNTQTTLSIPAPANSSYSNYICYLAYQVNNDNTGTAVSNVVSTSTNFGSFAVKFSAVATASIDSGVMVVLGAGGSATGCYKSVLAGTATTFVSPASVTHSAWTWYGGYFQAP